MTRKQHRKVEYISIKIQFIYKRRVILQQIINNDYVHIACGVNAVILMEISYTILYISHFFSRSTLKINDSRGTYVNIEKICFYPFTIRFTLYSFHFFFLFYISSILYDRYDFLFPFFSFFFLFFWCVNCIQFLDAEGSVRGNQFPFWSVVKLRSSWSISKFFAEKYVSRAAKQAYKISNIRLRVDREKSAAIKLRERGWCRGGRQRIQQSVDRMARLQTIYSNWTLYYYWPIV